MGWKEFCDWMDKPALIWYYESNQDDQEIQELRKQNTLLKNLLMELKHKKQERPLRIVNENKPNICRTE